MVAFVAFFLFSACLVLEFWTVDVQLSSARTRNDDFDAAAGKEMMKRSREGDGVEKVDIGHPQLTRYLQIVSIDLRGTIPGLLPATMQRSYHRSQKTNHASEEVDPSTPTLRSTSRYSRPHRTVPLNHLNIPYQETSNCAFTGGRPPLTWRAH